MSAREGRPSLHLHGQLIEDLEVKAGRQEEKLDELLVKIERLCVKCHNLGEQLDRVERDGNSTHGQVEKIQVRLDTELASKIDQEAVRQLVIQGNEQRLSEELEQFGQRQTKLEREVEAHRLNAKSRLDKHEGTINGMASQVRKELDRPNCDIENLCEAVYRPTLRERIFDWWWRLRHGSEGGGDDASTSRERISDWW